MVPQRSRGCAPSRPPRSVVAPSQSVQWFDEAGLLRLQLGDMLRVQVRPSGTEPKVKLYGEGIDCEPAEYLEALAALL